jgi:hypothetical protein
VELKVKGKKCQDLKQKCTFIHRFRRNLWFKKDGWQKVDTNMEIIKYVGAGRIW